MAGIDWSTVELVVFDVDGTLYRQRPVRLHMAAALLGNAVRSADLSVLRVLRRYRALREVLAERETRGFEAELVRAVAAEASLEEARVAAIVDHWINTRPLPLLRGARYPGVDRLFEAIRGSGRRIGVLSDYPAIGKLAALGLEADFIVSAEDEAVDVMKPSPDGLLHLIGTAGGQPETTILIGDRAERDGMAGRRAGVRTLLRSSRPVPGFETFSSYDQIGLPSGQPLP